MTTIPPPVEEDFQTELARLSNDHAARLMRARRVRSFAELRIWLVRKAPEFFANRLTGDEGDSYPFLLAAYQRRHRNDYEPETFVSESVPIEALIDCANTYGTVGRLLLAIRDEPHRVHRWHLYLAFHLGIITAQELERVPVRHDGRRIRKPRKRRKAKRSP